MIGSFVYDADGNRVQSTIGSTTTTFVGNYYEVSGSTVTKYYYAGSSRVAMNVGGTVSYLLSDQLGSTSITANVSGGLISELRYKAWGEVRYQSGTTPTKYTYTGQYSNMADFGLMFYNARWYDPTLGRFVQADTVVPAGVQGYDRYTYASNNPIAYGDPSGHEPCASDTCPSFVSVSVGIDIPTVMMALGAAISLIPGGGEVGVPLAVTGGLVEAGAYTGNPIAALLKSSTIGGTANVDAYGNLAVGVQASIGKSLTPVVGADITTTHLINSQNLGSFPSQYQTKSFISGPSISAVGAFPPAISAISPIPSGSTWSPTASGQTIAKSGWVIGTDLGSFNLSWTVDTGAKLWKSRYPWGNRDNVEFDYRTVGNQPR